MLAGTGNIICDNCNKVVPVAPGLCVICGAEFSQDTIDKEVTMILEAA